MRGDSETQLTGGAGTTGRDASRVGGNFYCFGSQRPPEPAQASSGATDVEPQYTSGTFVGITHPIS
jgi:hypothetical protein